MFPPDHTEDKDDRVETGRKIGNGTIPAGNRNNRKSEVSVMTGAPQNEKYREG